VTWHRLRSAHPVVKEYARAYVEPLPDSVLQGEQERHWPHQVWRDPVQEEVTFLQRLTHEREVALLEVAQPAVDQLA